MTTTHDTTTGLKATAIEQFKGSLRGDCSVPAMPLRQARAIHNGMIDRRPALIVRCAGVADVMAAVTFARTHNLVVAVRGGGHGVPGFAVCDGGLMIDLSRMKSVRVDPVRRTARAEGGCTWGTSTTRRRPLAWPRRGALPARPALRGLTLGGGHGYLMRTYGLSCDNLLSVDVVTADGRLLTASATEHADLFWGVRGGGGNFGVVTAFEYRLHPVSQMLGGLLIYPMDQAQDLFKFYRDYTRTVPDALGSLINLATLPDGTPAVVILIAYGGISPKAHASCAPCENLAP